MARPRVDLHGRDGDAHVLEADTGNFEGVRGGVTMAGEGGGRNVAGMSPVLRPETMARDTIIIKTHDGDGYTMKTHIEDIYRLRHRETLADAVKDGKFSLMTEGGNIILPAFWDRVVGPAAVVQVVLPSDILDPDVAAYLPYGNTTRPGYPSRRPSIPLSIGSVQNVDVDVGRRSSQDRARAGNGSELNDLESGSGDSDSERTSSGSEAESLASADTLSEIVRQVRSPMDDDGNDLVFKVDTGVTTSLGRDTANANNTLNTPQPVGDTESVSIAKVVSSQAEGRTWLQIFVLPGPRTASTHLDESIRWFHQRAATLDLNSFRETCLKIPGLSGRLQQLVRKTFDKVEKEKLKIYLDGMFIEPGTVLRADECNQKTNSESVIFSCIPYFDLQTPAKKVSDTGKVSRFPSRTLMQSYYPYEPVQERDAEQAYRKFVNEQRDALVHVPNMWIVNIGSSVVATCGHQALDTAFAQSIKLVAMDRNSTRDADHDRNIIVTDWNGRKILYTVGECRSYFQMEQKLKELQWCSSHLSDEIQLSWKTGDDQVKVTPGMWAGILRQKDNLAIHLSILGDDKSTEGAAQPPSLPALSSKPFFHWPQKTDTDDALSDETRSNRCLQLVEKAMLSEVLSSRVSYGLVEKTFTSTEYYRDLPQNSAKDVKSSSLSLQAGYDKSKKLKEKGFLTCHQALVLHQHGEVVKRTSALCDSMHSMLALFVTDDDNSPMLRKAWTGVQRICDVATKILGRQAVDSNSIDSEPSKRSATQQGWFVRPDISGVDESAPKPLRTSKRCKKCSAFKTYNTSSAALLHAKEHLNDENHLRSQYKPEDCVLNYAQMQLEVWNKGFIAILTKACQEAQRLVGQAKDISDGVINEDGQMSDLYMMPRSLIGAFRQLLVFFFAVERTLFYTERSLEEGMDVLGRMETSLFSSSGLETIEMFGNGARAALAAAHSELCAMVRSPGPLDTFGRLSLSPEYVCSWLMRRLIVKPLEKSMTVSDMYREYLSTIQFQVNHRPSKRVLRSINLLQEEIAALQEVNTQQSRLIANYLNVLDDTTYEEDIPYRRALFSYERMNTATCSPGAVPFQTAPSRV
ncbi:hypothetical protein OPT61_g9787 [Boeremia exigua]|uniref:Uncharacterized protein n=1 Tax=Boeremia exigua TaxID=749465 RepID=A0ACC2HU75_9PLEO|nr:hypothetical protein OPT61_g9787 [Boeremia exigua]